jgi:collagen type VII alpha
MSFVSVPITLVNGGRSDASDVNTNFQAIVDGLQDSTKDLTVNNVIASCITAQSAQIRDAYAYGSLKLPLRTTDPAVASSTIGQMYVNVDTFSTRVFDGSTWLLGMHGQTGTQGVQGLTGYSGITGPPGGATGLQGPTGSQGDTGVKGVTGQSIIGATGLQGFTGLLGFTGAKGETGASIKGETGLMGSTGLGVADAAYCSAWTLVPQGVEIPMGASILNVGWINTADAVVDNFTWQGQDDATPASRGKITALINMEAVQINAKIKVQTVLDADPTRTYIFWIYKNNAAIVSSPLINDYSFYQEIRLDPTDLGDIETITLSGIVKNVVAGDYFTVRYSQYASDTTRLHVAINIHSIDGIIGADGVTGLVGVTGSKGETGLIGLGVTGLQGAVGETGARGLTGLGLQGSTGLQGAVGSTGLVGQTGAVGSTGAVGETGARGFTGLGLQGSTGSVGQTGAVGSQGSTGVQGAVGSQGSTGVSIQGSTGVAGQTGLRGETGIIGSTGSIGQTGLVGSTGLRGMTGTSGVTGLQGLVGSTGAVGSTGSMGVTGTSLTFRYFWM